MALADKGNSRRAHEAEMARAITAGETAAFFTTLLAVLNEAEAAPRVIDHHDAAQPAAEPAAPHPVHPAELPASDSAPADGHHTEQHTDATDAPPAETAPTIHADADGTHQPQAVETAAEAAPSIETSSTHVALSSASIGNLEPSVEHTSTHEAIDSHLVTSIAPAPEPLTEVLTVADPIKGLVDSSLSTVSHAIADVTDTLGQITASLTSTIDQVTSSLTSTVSHLTDSVTGLVSSLVHDAPVTSVVQPLLTDVLGPSTDSAPHPSASPTHDISLLDTSGVIPTALFHPPPLHLGFLGQPTMDGHEHHDGAFSALGVHHF